MQDSLKGILITLTVIGLFITCILNFIILFPQEQGVTFNGLQDSNAYLTISQNNDSGTSTQLTNINNQTGNAFNQWDVTQGFMGSNTLKQSQGGITSLATNTFSSLQMVATQLFTANSPVVYALLIFAGLTTAYLIYAVIQFIRSGR